LAEAIALQYVLLELLTLLQLKEDGSWQDILAILWYSLLRDERHGGNYCDRFFILFYFILFYFF